MAAACTRSRGYEPGVARSVTLYMTNYAHSTIIHVTMYAFPQRRLMRSSLPQRVGMLDNVPLPCTCPTRLEVLSPNLVAATIRLLRRRNEGGEITVCLLTPLHDTQQTAFGGNQSNAYTLRCVIHWSTRTTMASPRKCPRTPILIPLGVPAWILPMASSHQRDDSRQEMADG